MSLDKVKKKTKTKKQKGLEGNIQSVQRSFFFLINLFWKHELVTLVGEYLIL